MHVTRFDAAPEYHAPGHRGMRCLRMLGKEAGPADFGWMGLSIIEPGGVIEHSASPYEKLYLVIEGALVFESGGKAATLGRLDACRIGPNEDRSISNRSEQQAIVALAMANVLVEKATA